MNVELADEAATLRLAGQLAAALPDDRRGMVVLLEGELGTGKSTLARGLIRALGHAGSVPSPTYTLVEPYELPGGPVYHVDLYRIASADELTFLGFDELDDGLALIEWPERAGGLDAAADLRIELRYAGRGRSARLAPLSPKGQALLAALPK
ncbi:MAG: tRNA (adenosine(37)-N6)-threonylcarbamoyltransferase complex ATPase subunit type 1 TsaE [Woeseiaceae bacterium]|nr:tRNA (adenosine(37)-N6)-threonylcarbamoyltransferase complex ATPase subunit type 1 TsaE [Woeseiaceae bacterium]